MTPDDRSILKAVRIYPPSLRELYATVELLRSRNYTFNGIANILWLMGRGRTLEEAIEICKPYMYERHKDEDGEDGKDE